MPEIFKNYTVYGPYLSKSENRRIAVLVSAEHRTTMSWARYLMCREQNRWLSDDETVDHINDDKLDDRIENLQILSRADNNRKSHPGRQTKQHGNLSMLRYCKPPCEECSKAKREYQREYMREYRARKT